MPRNLVAASTSETFERVKKSFEDDSPVTYVRFSHGEFKGIKGMVDPCQQPVPKLRDELIEALGIEDPNYLVALNDVHPKEEKMDGSLFYNPKYARNTIRSFPVFLNAAGVPHRSSFENSVFFHYYAAFRTEEFLRFFVEHIQPKRKMFIGSLPKKECEKLLGKIDIHVETPEKEAYGQIDKWWPHIRRGYKDVEVILMACGPSAAVIGKRLWLKGNRSHFLTLGGSIDAAVGFTTGSRTRAWIESAKEEVRRLQKLCRSLK